MLPAQHYPTTVLLIDDDLEFLHSLTMHLPPSLCYKPFDSAREALSYIHAQQDVVRQIGLLDDAVLRVSYSDAEPTLNQRSIHLALDKIHQAVYNPRRFSEIAAIVVDYAMPEMNGLELCTKLNQSSIKRILLTGEADALIGVEAFNVGLIHHFIKKQSRTLVPQLNLAIEQMCQHHLESKGALLNHALNMADISFLSDVTFKALIMQLMEEHGFVEYYLMANPEGLLFLRADGSMQRLVVETVSSLDSHIEAAESADAPVQLITALKQKSVVPFFWKSGGLYGPECTPWEDYVGQAAYCAGQQAYYWTLLETEEGIDRSAIYTYNDHLQRRPMPEKS